jgi:hypothetical protein
MSRRRLWMSAIAVLLVGVLAVTWLFLTFEARRLAWWEPPSRLHLLGRDYQRVGGTPAVGLSQAEGTVPPGIVWRRVGQEWPMRWTIWATVFAHGNVVPTVVFVRKDRTHYVPYALQGGP